MNKELLKKIHKHSFRNKTEIEKSSICGCFRCLYIFKEIDIKQFVDKGETALCPRCSVDSVIGSASGYDITTELLQDMKKHFFY